MKLIEHDVTFAFFVLIGLIVLFLSPRYAWTETPGAVVVSEIAKEAEKEGVYISELDDDGTQFMEEIYQDTRYWMSAEWPYGWRFRLNYSAISLFVVGVVSLIRGFGLVKIPWRVVVFAAFIPYLILLLAMVLEVIRGSTILQGFWMCLIGGGLILFGTVMMRPKSKPEQIV